MDQQKKLEALAFHHNLQLTCNDRLFYSKYLYRITFYFCPEDRIGILYAIRKFAKRNESRVRLEAYTLNYYTNTVSQLETLIKYVQTLKDKETYVSETMLDISELRYFPGSITERNIYYRKKRLPYGNCKFQILGIQLEYDQYKEWRDWASQYPKDIRIKQSQYNRLWGTWCGESIGYISTDKLLQLVRFKLGSRINKIIEYQIKGIETK